MASGNGSDWGDAIAEDFGEGEALVGAGDWGEEAAVVDGVGKAVVWGGSVWEQPAARLRRTIALIRWMTRKPTVGGCIAVVEVGKLKVSLEDKEIGYYSLLRLVDKDSSYH